MFTKVEAGMRGCTKCGIPYKNPFAKGIYINKCNDCYELGHPTSEIMDSLGPLMQTSALTWKKLLTAMRKHHLRFDRLAALLTKDKCARCGNLLVGMPHFDHDHACCEGPSTCGKCIRGVICARCNLMMAGYDDYQRNPDQTDRYIATYRKQRDENSFTNLSQSL